jgi:hypothetical protein
MSLLYVVLLASLLASSAGRSVYDKFNGPFSLVNVTSPFGSATAQWLQNPRGQIAYWRDARTMSAVLNHDPLDANNNAVPLAQATDSQILASSICYAGSFAINITGQYVVHYPQTTGNPKTIPEYAGSLDAIAEPRCYRWFDNDNVLQLFLTTQNTQPHVDCSAPLVASLFWQRIVSFEAPGDGVSCVGDSLNESPCRTRHNHRK